MVKKIATLFLLTFLLGATPALASFSGTDLLGHVIGDMVQPDSESTATAPEARVKPTPIPGAIWLLGTGAVGLIGLRRKFK